MMGIALQGIEKSFGGNKVMHGFDLAVRDGEMVALMGPSGCGKTTVLNLLSGILTPDGGEVLGMEGKRITYLFAENRLILHKGAEANLLAAMPHPDLARAREILDSLGIQGDAGLRPVKELSFGMARRVAIARAIVNNPDIILADEPTGALDTETSVQVMEILKEISKNRLIIMVTHNPDLAQRYSTRIVRMLDGLVTGDSAPLSPQEAQAERAASVKKDQAARKGKRPSMSFVTSFGLSLKNLFTKKGRTALTSFAGSIGIIGIALIYAVSQGTTAYIDAVQEDTLSSYPLTLQAQTMDLGSLMEEFISAAQSSSEHENDAVYQKPMIYDMVNALNSSETIENDLASFKTYLEPGGAGYLPRLKIASERAIRLTKEAGGKAVLAHPKLTEYGDFDELLQKLKVQGLEGIEAYYPAHSDRETAYFEKLADRYGLFVTCGSDFHGATRKSTALGREQRAGLRVRRDVAALFRACGAE